MCLGVLRTERYGGFESGRCVFEILPIGIGKSEIQKQVPFFESQPDRRAVFADLFGRESRHPVGEPQMIVEYESVRLLQDGEILLGAVYLLGTVLTGGLAAIGGIALGAGSDEASSV